MVKIRRFDWLLFGSMLFLIGIGTCAIWSAGNARAEVLFHDKWIDNLGTACVGLLLYFVFAFVDYRRTLDFLSIPAYLVSIVFLIAVLLFGSTVYGGRRWLWFFQPSEISKLCVICLVARAFCRSHVPILGIEVRSFRSFLLALFLLGLPAFLILAEPDLGTTLTLVPAILIMVLVAGVWRKGMMTLLAAGGLVSVLVLGAIYEAEKPGVSAAKREKILRCLPLKAHQVKRIRVFLFPEQDVTGAGYNLRQAKISIGSGGFTGKGIGKAESNQLKYLPPAISMNDFIFCVFAEESGYRGSLLLLGLFMVMILSGCRIAFFAEDGLGRLLAIGVTTLLFAHVYINVAMSIGLVPITGLPLPFISSGRTFLITVMCGLGLVQSVSIHREEIKI